jgi:hypothetical protein
MASFFPTHDLAYNAWSEISQTKAEAFSQFTEGEKDALFDELVRLTKSVTAAIECSDERLLISHLAWLVRGVSNKYFTVEEWQFVLEHIFDGVAKTLEKVTGITCNAVADLRKVAIDFLNDREQPLIIGEPYKQVILNTN